MKLYSDAGGTAPSPRRVRIFIAEKKMTVEIVELNLHEENRTPEFAEKNPMQTVPVLELEDGTCIAESIAICRYLEAISPEAPQLFGSTPIEIANVEMWNRRSELAFYLPIELAGGFLGRRVAERARKQVDRMLRLFDDELATRPFIAGDAYSVADITTQVAIDFGIRFNGIAVPDDAGNLRRWHAEMAARPSAAA
jgi:glutathione S-transferase